MTRIAWQGSSSYSPEENRRAEPTFEIGSDKLSPASPEQSDITAPSDSPLFTEPQPEYHSIGLDALEMLHNQLQILARQDCDKEMADIMEDKVTESLQKQNSDLQRSLECLQTSDQNLRVSLKIAEMRAQEAEIKLHHTADRCHKLERDCRWLETEFKILYQKYHEMQKHLQKKAILYQMSLENRSPSRSRRPNSAQNRRQRSLDTVAMPGFVPVKRHNSSEYIHQNHHHHHQQHHVHHHHQQPTYSNHMTSSNTLPRLHSSSFSHTETRV